MKYEEKILKLFKNGYLETKDVVKNNIPRIYLSRLLKENKIERVNRGIYAKKMKLEEKVDNTFEVLK